MPKTDRYMAIAKAAAREAGKIHLKYFHKGKGVRTKGVAIDLVTNADIEADKAIRRIIRKAFPDHAIVSEELEKLKGNSAYTWYIDPLDGTNNYAHNYPHFCVSIGLCKDDKPILGAVFQPLTKQMFWAIRGRGAYLNKTKIKVSTTSTPKGSLVATGLPYKRKPFRKNILKAFATMYDRIMGLRRAGSAALDLCYVAAGWIDCYYEHWINPWDIMAGTVIVQEAGGKVTTIDSKPIEPKAKISLLAANPRLHKTFVKLLNR